MVVATAEVRFAVNPPKYFGIDDSLLSSVLPELPQSTRYFHGRFAGVNGGDLYFVCAAL